MKALLRGKIIVDGWKSENDKEVVTKSLDVEALISLPALPQKGDEMYFEAPDGSYNIIDQATVNCVYWVTDEEQADVMFPIIELEDSDYAGLIGDNEHDKTVEENYQFYNEELDKPPRIGTVNWKRMV